MPEDDKWATYSNDLRRAIDNLVEIGESRDDVEEMVEQALDDNFDTTEHVGGGPKKAYRPGKPKP